MPLSLSPSKIHKVGDQTAGYILALERLAQAFGTETINTEDISLNESRVRVDEAGRRILAKCSSFHPDDVLASREIIRRTLLALSVSVDAMIDNTHAYVPCRAGSAHTGQYPHEAMDSVLAAWLTGNELIMRVTDDSASLLEALAGLLPLQQEIRFTREVAGPLDAYIMNHDGGRHGYQQKYYGSKPSLIRNPSYSVLLAGRAIPADEAKALMTGIHLFNGKAPESIRMIWVESEDVLQYLLRSSEANVHVMERNKWMNNYEYRKSIFLINSLPFLDNGWACFRREDGLFPPAGVVYYHVDPDLTAWRSMAGSECARLHQYTLAGKWIADTSHLPLSGPGQYPWAKLTLESCSFLRKIVKHE